MKYNKSQRTTSLMKNRPKMHKHYRVIGKSNKPLSGFDKIYLMDLQMKKPKNPNNFFKKKFEDATKFFFNFFLGLDNFQIKVDCLTI